MLRAHAKQREYDYNSQPKKDEDMTITELRAVRQQGDVWRKVALEYQDIGMEGRPINYPQLIIRIKWTSYSHYLYNYKCGPACLPRLLVGAGVSPTTEHLLGHKGVG